MLTAPRPLLELSSHRLPQAQELRRLLQIAWMVSRRRPVGSTPFVLLSVGRGPLLFVNSFCRSFCRPMWKLGVLMSGPGPGRGVEGPGPKISRQARCLVLSLSLTVHQW